MEYTAAGLVDMVRGLVKAGVVEVAIERVVCDFAADSRHAHPWAAKLYHHAIQRGKDPPHATCILTPA